MNEQLVLGLSLKETLEKEDFFISSSNLEAVTLLDNSDRWGSGVLLLVGPKGSGKTHLALIWCKENKAKHVKLETVFQENVPESADAERVMTQMALQGTDLILSLIHI